MPIPEVSKQVRFLPKIPSNLYHWKNSSSTSVPQTFPSALAPATGDSTDVSQARHRHQAKYRHSTSSRGSQGPIEVAMDNLACYIRDLPRSEFQTTLDMLRHKLHYAIKATRTNHQGFYQWVFDFFNSLSSTIDMFGPVPKPHYLKDFTQVSWILTMLKPLLMLALPKNKARPLTHAEITTFTETCDILEKVTIKYRRSPCIYKDLIEELWDMLVRILIMAHQSILVLYAFSLCRTILAKVPLCDEMIYKILQVRVNNVNYFSQDFIQFRALHAVILKILISQAQRTNSIHYVDTISREILKCSRFESDPNTRKILERSLYSVLSINSN